MATFEDSLVIKVIADIKAFTANMLKVKEVAASSTGAATKAVTGFYEGLRKLRAVMLQIRGTVLFVGLAFSALAMPVLKADDAFHKLEGSLVLAGKSFAGARDAAMRAATAIGSTYATAAESARVAVLRYGQSTAGAMKAVTSAHKLATLGLDSEENAMKSVLGVSEAFNLDMQKSGDAITNALGRGAVLAKADLRELAAGLEELGPNAQRLHVDFAALVSTIVAARQNGATLDEALAGVKAAMEIAVKPTQDQATALTNLGIGAQSFAGTGIVNVMQQLGAAAAVADPRFAALADSNEDLAKALTSANGQMPQFVGAFSQMATSGQAVAAAIDQGASALDKLMDILPSLANSLSDIAGALNSVGDAWNRVKDFFNTDLTPQGMSLSNIWQAISGGGGYTSPERHAFGGPVGGFGSGDIVPAMLEPGEFVIRSKVAKQMRPFLEELNRSGVHASSLWKTSLANTLIRGTHTKLLDALGILPDAEYERNRFGPKPTTESIQYGVNAIIQANHLRRALDSLHLQRGGSVPVKVAHFADGGAVGSGGSGRIPTAAVPQVVEQHSHFHVGTMNNNFRGNDITPTMIRDKFVPSIKREFKQGRDRRSRSRR